MIAAPRCALAEGGTPETCQGLGAGMAGVPDGPPGGVGTRASWGADAAGATPVTGRTGTTRTSEGCAAVGPGTADWTGSARAAEAGTGRERVHTPCGSMVGSTGASAGAIGVGAATGGGGAGGGTLGGCAGGGTGAVGSDAASISSDTQACMPRTTVFSSPIGCSGSSGGGCTVKDGFSGTWDMAAPR